MRALPLLVVTLAVVVVSGACRRACETAENCKRTCECVDATTSAQLDCTMAFRCETAELACEADFDELACADVCNQYAAVGKCGFQRCANDFECVQTVTCPILAQDGRPSGLTYQCTLNFTCEQDVALCQKDSELPDDQLCLLRNLDGSLRCPPPAGG